MKLKYINMDKVVIGTHTQDERKFQITNHFNIVENEIQRTFDAINEMKKRCIKSDDWEMSMYIERIEHHLGNVKAQHFNEGYEIKNIDNFGVISA